jgi:NAD(P)-dependent dehydrogenase (short-subunit alcohol dehydrogenase family)
VQDRQTIKTAAAETKKTFGKLDILINNAGYLETFIPVSESDEDDYWTTWEINYRGVYWMTKEFLPLLLDPEYKDGYKTIVNLSSIGAHLIRPGASSYQTTKFALLRFTEFLMAENAEKGLLAYAVHPGGVMTELAMKMPKAVHAVLTDTPEVAADTMVFLTQEKRDWLAGRYISCTWDMKEFLSMENDIVTSDKLKMRLVV